MIRLAIALVCLIFIATSPLSAQQQGAGVVKGENNAQFKKGKKSPKGQELAAYIEQQKSQGVKGKKLQEAIRVKRAELGMKPKKGGKRNQQS